MKKRMLYPIVLGTLINSLWVTMRNTIKRNITRTLFAPVLVLLSTGVWSFANAATYHVRVDGNDTSCNGSANASSSTAPNCAFRTVQKGLNVAQAGDTVSVHAGNYSTATINSVRAGTASARITISGAGDGTATLGRTNILAGHDYITMRGLNFAGFTNGTAGKPSVSQTLINVKGKYFTYTNNHMQPTNAGSYGFALGIRTNAAYTTISDSTFEAGTVVNGPSFFNVITLDYGGDNAYINHNIFKNMIDVERVFELWANNIKISNNEIYNLKSTWPSWCHPDIWQTWASPAPANLLVENNYLHDLQTQIGIVEYGITRTANTPWIFRNNVFANIDMCQFIGVEKVYWYNNTFYRVSRGCPAPINGGYKGADKLDVRNNIFVGSGTNDNNGWYAFQSGTGDYNFVSTLTYGKKGGFSEAHGINGGNPMFVNAKSDCINNACDFHLAAGSVVIGKATTITNVSADGTPISAFSTDKDGKSRTTGHWDMGAYAYGSNVATILPPQNLRVY
ncbi:hypothetical protein [Candidatus Methylomicrobium oryzae]|uniref:hypothetical protein n=1 Tax=Candidatus Methylomicrobium oryzae TaxID=2802053 RepID=UPI0019232C6B|nr:hypothetical protein [Methylomicrobium sp. RS1]MBL1264884.1 hypothetical protein [Methylomicrobium sp. RS1]